MRDRIRVISYKYSVLIVTVAAVSLTLILHFMSFIDELLKKQDSLISVATALAGFLFTGQGILLTLSPENKFMQLAVKYKYIEDVHHDCVSENVAITILGGIRWRLGNGALFGSLSGRKRTSYLS